MTRETPDDELPEALRKAIEDGEAFADDDPIFVALQEAAKSGGGSIDLGTLGRPRQLTPDEEPVADAIRRASGSGPSVVRREPAKSVLVHITPAAQERLRQIAETYDYWHNGRGNLSQLLEAIGQGKLIVSVRD